ncbi:hypothetical protein J2S43_002919 [Catenuloplanes nepalensis]|uniref:Uncharacterized protein n=1 Tax=Catenuloplanes nepalensis TaxID=587533 RepID=A0ABT9MSJ7_9ACTN|nr:hypothetical protein [Catenuloplanes nepalensis]
MLITCAKSLLTAPDNNDLAHVIDFRRRRTAFGLPIVRTARTAGAWLARMRPDRVDLPIVRAAQTTTAWLPRMPPGGSDRARRAGRRRLLPRMPSTTPRDADHRQGRHPQRSAAQARTAPPAPTMPTQTKAGGPADDLLGLSWKTAYGAARHTKPNPAHHAKEPGQRSLTTPEATPPPEPETRRRRKRNRPTQRRQEVEISGARRPIFRCRAQHSGRTRSGIPGPAMRPAEAGSPSRPRVSGPRVSGPREGDPASASPPGVLIELAS